MIGIDRALIIAIILLIIASIPISMNFSGAIANHAIKMILE